MAQRHTGGIVTPEGLRAGYEACNRCGHDAHAGKCAGDPLDVPDSGIGGSEPHVPEGCRCGDPEFEPEPVAGDYEAPGQQRALHDADEAAAAIAEARATLADVAAMRERLY